ncbi:MAG TPA: dihydrolipoamide acetyltransferase family protein [Gemmataceae bacterium]|nr:dihydrolipoamide acetyltransferase family protein [Gemmataceae bacterium]
MTNQQTGKGKRPARTIASPRARRAMANLDIAPSLVRGTGPAGRIVEADVMRVRSTPALALPGVGTPLPLSPMRRAVAQRTAQSFATVPHFYLCSEIDATALVDLCDQLQRAGQKGTRSTLSDLLLRGMALALRDCPHANRIWQRDSILQLSSGDVGLVVGLEDGLLIPVIRAVDTLSLAELACRRADAVSAARSGKLAADALHPCATSLSNLGASRVDEFTAVIPPPQSSVLSIGRAAPRPFVIDGQLCVRQTLHLCLAVDHRVMDGLPAARFLERIIELLEKPAGLV